MIRFYIYKILYNNYKIGVFINKESIDKYKLKYYKDLKSINLKEQLNNIFKIDYKIKTLKNDYYKQSFTVIKQYKEEEFKNKIKPKDFKFGVDNFYVVSYNIILSNLCMDNSDINKDFYYNFYNNICEPLFKGEKLLFKAITLLYEPTSYSENKQKYKINSNNIKALLFGYRFCLNEIESKNKKGIYYPIYDSNNLNYLREKLFPGNDCKPNKIYYNIINHFKSKPDEGCYVCLCEKGYYHSLPSGFPDNEELNKKCPKCLKPLDKRDNYFRIFKDDKDIEEVKKDKNNRKKMKEINYLTLEQFKEKYIYPLFKDEKGVYITDKNSFINDEKIIRNLSPISYRLLNYILYTHLFFARLITNKKDFDKYLPNGMTWIDVLDECWNILKIELLKENIESIEKFIHYIFIYLFPILNKAKNIDNYENLIKFEDILESNIQKLIKQFKDEINLLTHDEMDKNSFINLLKEKYTSNSYSKEEYPFYEYFYYTDYLNEMYINEKLKHMDQNKYPVLKKYLDKVNDKTYKNKNSLDKLNIFNNALNLINEKYSNNISRKQANKIKLKDVEIYINNKELIDDFINFYNAKSAFIKLSNDNFLNDFFIDEDSNIGKTYYLCYKDFILQQNELIENLLDMKIEKGIFDDNCKDKIDIQRINENEIFTLNLPEKMSLIDILFNSSYRKILDSDIRSYDLYKEYEINYDFIEEYMTELLLKNKKLLNENITKFIYNNEVFSNQLTDSFTLFKKRYIDKNININDKIIIYKFVDENKKNINMFINIINDFITLIKFLNDKRKEGNNNENDYSEQKKIYEVINKLKDRVSKYFIKIFENNDGLTIDKTFGILEYYLKLIYEDIKNYLNDYQEKLDEESIKKLKDYYQNNQNKHLINKKDFAHAIRLFITLVLVPEEDKEKKIKYNHNNLVNYLKSSDLWKKEIYDKEDFNKNLNELKLINAKINQIISLYEILGKDIEDNFCEDVKKKIEIEEEKDNNYDNDAFPPNRNEESEDSEDNNLDNKSSSPKMVVKDNSEDDSKNSNDNAKKSDEDDEDEDDPFAKKSEDED